MGIDGVHTANIVTMMYRANGKAVPSMVFDIEDVHREQWKMYRGSACRSGTVSNVSWIFKVAIFQGDINHKLSIR
jgi:hypothetical protein